MHGIDSYPSSFTKLIGLQEALGGEKHKVVLKVLSHLERTHFIEDIRENDCLYVIDMIEKQLISDPKTDLTPALQNTLIMILKQAPKSSKLLEYLYSKVDPKSLDYLEICGIKHGLVKDSDVARL